MAINLDDRYPGRAGPKNLAYPQGSFKNRTSPTSKDGTYLEKDWANDWAGFFQALLSYAGMTANGVVDTAQASQYFDALVQTIKSQDASETSKGVLEIATAAEAQALTDDERALTPKKLADAFKGGNQSLAGNGYQKLPGGLIMQWGSFNSTATGDFSVTLPIAFPGACLMAQATPAYYSTDTTFHFLVRTKSTTSVVFTGGNTENNAWALGPAEWFAIGY